MLTKLPNYVLQVGYNPVYLDTYICKVTFYVLLKEVDFLPVVICSSRKNNLSVPDLYA